MKSNKKATVPMENERLAGGMGMQAAASTDEQKLRRLVLTCMLGENNAYIDGVSIKEEIANLIPKLPAHKVAELALEAREKQKLRHVPLFIATEMLKYTGTRAHVAKLLPKIIRRPDELAETVSLYWNGKKKPLAAQLKKGLAKAFLRFDEYQFAKYNRKNEIKLRDVMFLTHPKPTSPEMEQLFKKLANDELSTPDTWEVAISGAKSQSERIAAWERLITTKKIPSLAFIKNLRNMARDNVSKTIIREGLKELPVSVLVPLNLLLAQKKAPEFTDELENLFFKFFEGKQKLPGHTVLAIDVSGSMSCSISSKSTATRMDVGFALAQIARELCESVSVYLTAGDYTHKTALVPAFRGFALADKMRSMESILGYGGIYTRQCLEYIKTRESNVDRIIVFSDSQDCDSSNKLPAPFGKKNYIVDVSSHKLGVNYKGVWTAEISGWSENFLDFILASEGLEALVEQ